MVYFDALDLSYSRLRGYSGPSQWRREAFQMERSCNYKQQEGRKWPLPNQKPSPVAGGVPAPARDYRPGKEAVTPHKTALLPS